MMRYGFIRAAAMAGLLVLSAVAADKDSGESTGSTGMDARSAVSPVLRNADPTDTRVVRLPGPRRVEAATATPVTVPIYLPVPVAAPLPVLAPAPVSPPAAVAPPPPVRAPMRETSAPPPAPRPPKLQASAAMTASVRRAPATIPKPAPADPRPVARRKSPLPPDFEADSSEFCRQRIGIWTEADARAMLGEPRRSRPSFGPDNAENGRILAFADPSGRRHQLELGFDRGSGRLLTVFVYPWDMTWEECQRLWGAEAIPAKTNKGRTFYSYADRRLDVLVDADGKVVSLGLY